MTTRKVLRFALALLCGVLMLGASSASAQSIGARSFIQGQAARLGKGGSAPSAGRALRERPSPAPRGGGSQREFVTLLFGMRGDVATTGSLGTRRERPRILITPEPQAEAGGGGHIGYCVRRCDGRFFPLSGRVSGAADPGAQAQCNAFCPAAEVAVFTAPDRVRGIEGALDAAGRPYSALPNAFVFRQRLVEGCTCTPGGGPAGLARVEVKEDVSLRRGDILATDAGLRVFAGGRKGPPFRDEDFVLPSAFPDLPADLRRRLRDFAFVLN